MAGATVAIPGSISALETNPAGLTMTMGSVSAQINSSETRDRTVNGSDSKPIMNRQGGLAVVPGNWGYAITYYTPSYEGGSYTSPTTGRTSDYEVSIRQLRFSVARSFLNKRLSLGLNFNIDHATRVAGAEDSSATDFSYKLGAIYHLRNHFLVGMSYTPPQDIGDGLARSGGNDLPGFAQPIKTPMILTIGTGWIPNRYFSLGFSVATVGTTSNSALLRDQNKPVGEYLTLQPRMGASYMIAEYKWVRISTAVGAYYETPRIKEAPNRLHGTFALQVNPWFLNIGFGLDEAERYNNLTFSVGIDIVRTARTLKIIPKDTMPPRNGFWPEPFPVRADGLPPALTEGEKKEFSSPSVGDVGTIIEEIPKNIENTLKGEPIPSEIREMKENQKVRKPMTRKKH